MTRLYVAPLGTPPPNPGWPIGTPDDPWTEVAELPDGPCAIIQEIEPDTRQFEETLGRLRWRP